LISPPATDRPPAIGHIGAGGFAVAVPGPRRLPPGCRGGDTLRASGASRLAENGPPGRQTLRTFAGSRPPVAGRWRTPRPGGSRGPPAGHGGPKRPGTGVPGPETSGERPGNKGPAALAAGGPDCPGIPGWPAVPGPPGSTPFPGPAPDRGRENYEKG